MRLKYYAQDAWAGFCQAFRDAWFVIKLMWYLGVAAFWFALAAGATYFLVLVIKSAWRLHSGA